MKFFKPVLIVSLLIAAVEAALVIACYQFQSENSQEALGDTVVMALIFGMLVIQLFGAIFAQLQLKKAYQGFLTYGISIGGSALSLLLAFIISTIGLSAVWTAEFLDLAWAGFMAILLLLGIVFGLFTAIFITKSAKQLRQINDSQIEQFGDSEEENPITQ